MRGRRFDRVARERSAVAQAAACLLLCTAAHTRVNAEPQTLANALAAAYARIDSVSCEVRKITKAEGRTVRLVVQTGPNGTVRPDEILRLLDLDLETVARADIRRTAVRLG